MTDNQGLHCHLHVHDEYSQLDGVQHVKDYPAVAKAKLGATHLAQTNHGVLNGAWAFTKSCREAGVHPIIGLEAYVTNGDHRVRSKDEHNKAYYHLILLAKNNAGLKDLFKLSTLSYTEGMYYKPRMSLPLIAQHSDNLLATTACLGSNFSQMIMRGDHKAAERLIDEHHAVFRDRFFVELQTHTTPEQQLVNQVLINIAGRKNLPLVLTSDAHYTHSHEKHFHETTLRMNTNASPDDDGFSFGDIECHLHTHDELASRAKTQGIPYEAISNTVFVAGIIDDASYFSDRKNHFPTYKNLPTGMTSWQFLEAIAYGGLQKRVGFPVPAEYEARFREELSQIKRAGLCDYLLVVWECLAQARSMDVWLGPGRGSSAASLLCWALEITHIDPIKYDLVFSRFLNPGRVGTPLIF